MHNFAGKKVLKRIDIQPVSFGAGPHRILYDGAAMTSISLECLHPAFWEIRNAVLDQMGGRGQALAIQTEVGPAVLRRYLRGGKLARLLADRYVFTGFERSRAFREWRLLAQLHALDLPVPRPLMASCERRGAIYRAGLMTSRIEGARTLATLAEKLDQPHWQSLVETLQTFFDAGVVHPDLNANNLLLDVSGRWYLIDFDRARQVAGKSSPGPMVRRLLRSFDRLGIKAGREQLEQLL